MLQALGAFLQVLNSPLNAMGNGMMLNSEFYMDAAPYMASQPMSTVAFNIFAGPWIQYLGNLAVAAGNLMVSLNQFLIGLKGIL